ncbi:hypothetical protein ACFQY5_31105 [Paeniroseomonas aquatica]|uniref:hypothetical protein n=1 Tax=Paeniroseomonas aquatica TaxID=373043 RepID=UPI00360B5D79
MSEILERPMSTTTAAATPLVKVRDLSVRFVSRDATMHAVNGVDIDLAAGRCSASSANPARASRSPCGR